MRFLAFLRSRRRCVTRPRVSDVDAFILRLRPRYSRTVVSDYCSSLRSFARFLHATDRLPADLAPSIVAPKVSRSERPYRTLPWGDVKCILQAVDRKARGGHRDYALLLMMSLYGLGAGEVACLKLEDIDWSAGKIHVLRPKTGVEFVLPLLPAVARALEHYLRRERPKHAYTRHLFVTVKAPHKQFGGSSTIRRILHKHARKAGVSSSFLGTHVLRHTHACRQIELGTRPKVLSDILGHRSPQSSSAYPRSHGSIAGYGIVGAAMTVISATRLARDIGRYLEFKRALGYSYQRGELILRAFERFAREPAHQQGRSRIDLESAVMTWLLRGTDRSALTISMDLGVVRQLCQHRRRSDPEGFVPDRALGSQARSKYVPHVFSREDVCRPLRAAAQPRYYAAKIPAITVRTMMLVLYCTGLRFGEARRLLIRDVDLHQNVITVRESKGRTRLVPFGVDLAREIRHYLDDLPCNVRSASDRTNLFVDRYGEPLKRTAIQYIFTMLLRKEGLKPPRGRMGARPYDFRHAFAVRRLTDWYHKGIDVHARLPWLSAYMGHLNVLGTEVYLHATPELLQFASQRLERHLALQQ